jgi:hypothetical protein
MVKWNPNQYFLSLPVVFCLYSPSFSVYLSSSLLFSLFLLPFFYFLSFLHPTLLRTNFFPSLYLREATVRPHWSEQYLLLTLAAFTQSILWHCRGVRSTLSSSSESKFAYIWTQLLRWRTFQIGPDPGTHSELLNPDPASKKPFFFIHWMIYYCTGTKQANPYYVSSNWDLKATHD